MASRYPLSLSKKDDAAFDAIGVKAAALTAGTCREFILYSGK